MAQRSRLTSLFPSNVKAAFAPSALSLLSTSAPRSGLQSQSPHARYASIASVQSAPSTTSSQRPLSASTAPASSSSSFSSSFSASASHSSRRINEIYAASVAANARANREVITASRFILKKILPTRWRFARSSCLTFRPQFIFIQLILVVVRCVFSTRTFYTAATVSTVNTRTRDRPQHGSFDCRRREPSTIQRIAWPAATS